MLFVEKDLMPRINYLIQIGQMKKMKLYLESVLIKIGMVTITFFVNVVGEVDEETGYVIDLKKLSDIIKVRIIDKMDHKNLNLEVDFMNDEITTAENIAIKIYEELEKDIQSTGNNLYSVKLYETENNYVEYYGKEENYEWLIYSNNRIKS